MPDFDWLINAILAENWYYECFCKLSTLAWTIIIRKTVLVQEYAWVSKAFESLVKSQCLQEEMVPSHFCCVPSCFLSDQQLFHKTVQRQCNLNREVTDNIFNIVSRVNNLHSVQHLELLQWLPLFFASNILKPCWGVSMGCVYLCTASKCFCLIPAKISKRPPINCNLSEQLGFQWSLALLLRQTKAHSNDKIFILMEIMLREIKDKMTLVMKYPKADPVCHTMF